MRKLLFWNEVGLSEKEDAEARLQSILNDDVPIVFGELDEKLQSFASEAHEQFSEMEFGGPAFESEPGGEPGLRCYSRHGLIIQLGDGLPNNTVSKSYNLAAPLGLTMYNPQGGYVFGVDDDLGVDVSD